MQFSYSESPGDKDSGLELLIICVFFFLLSRVGMAKCLSCSYSQHSTWQQLAVAKWKPPAVAKWKPSAVIFVFESLVSNALLLIRPKGAKLIIKKKKKFQYNHHTIDHLITPKQGINQHEWCSSLNPEENDLYKKIHYYNKHIINHLDLFIFTHMFCMICDLFCYHS